MTITIWVYEEDLQDLLDVKLVNCFSTKLGTYQVPITMDLISYMNRIKQGLLIQKHTIK
jgi:hypothetical protein